MKNPGRIVHEWKIEQEKKDNYLDYKYGYITYQEYIEDKRNGNGRRVRGIDKKRLSL